ncbi:MAG: hypothetical protein HGGPFJEG_02913 [Ignavibacteria bacterium]|nr:hypothetical protein [Ignavibacteria bacterium]
MLIQLTNNFLKLNLNKMTNFKSSLSVIAMLISAVITGCSDSPLSFNNPESSAISSSSETFDANSRLSTYSEKIKLKSGESFTITKEQANLVSFREVRVSECKPDEVRIWSTTIDSDLSCHWFGYNGFGLDDITIENTGKLNKVIDFSLSGVALKPTK